MQAAQFQQFGDPAEVVSVREVERPRPDSSHVLVRMLAAPVNPSDLLFIGGTYRDPVPLPAVGGLEGVGIAETGGGAIGWLRKGQRVAVVSRTGGTWAEWVTVPAKQCIPVPDELADEQAAMFVVNPMTAYAMTREVLAVPAGEWLLQTAAASALGRMVVRLGRHFGFKTINVVRRESQVEELRSLGADAVVVFDGNENEPAQLEEQVFRHTGGPVSYAIDPVGGATSTAVIRCLGEAGRVLIYGSLDTNPIEFDPRQFLMNRAKIESFFLGPWLDSQSLPHKLQLIRQLGKLARAGVFETPIAHTVPLADVSEGLRLAQQSGRDGKVVIRISEA